MTPPVAWFSANWRTVLLIFGGALIQLFLIAQPLDFLIVYLIPDDAFYYFEIARNIAAGAGSTFDGLSPTNGYHPLWLLVLIPIFKLFSSGGANDIAPIHAALVLSVALNVATAYLVSRIVQRFAENVNIRALGLFIFIFNPYLLYETLNGLETSLSLFFFALFFLFALRIQEAKSSNYILAGIFGALMTLARLDLALYVVAFLGWIMLRHGLPAEASAQAGWKEGRQYAFVTGLIAFVVVAPWFLWSMANFGTPMTSSSEASTIVNHQLIVQDHGDSWFQTFKAVIYNSQYELDKLFERTGMYAIGCAVFGAAVALILAGHMSFPRRVAFLSVAEALAIGFAMLFFANAGVRWTARSWYFVSFNVFLAILAATVADVLVAKISQGWRNTAIVLMALAIVFSFFVNWSKNQRHGMPQQKEMYEAALWMNENLPSGSVIGVFNAGIQGYVSNHTIVNLDGLVNNAALAALKQKRLWSYVKEAGIEYVSDFPLYLTYRYKSFLDAENIFNELIPVQAPAGALSIWRLK